MVARDLVLTLGWVFLSLAVVQGSLAQERPDTTRTPVPDTSDVPVSDSLRQPTSGDSLSSPTSPSADSLSPNAGTGRSSSSSSRPDRASGRSAGSGSGQNNPNAVTFSATDSLVIRSDSAASDRGTLYGEADMSYQEATLEARTIELDFETATLQAEGSPSDTLANGRPIFRQGGGGGQQGRTTGGGGGEGGQSFTGETLSYNLNTKRGRVVAARTERKNAYIDGGAVKMFEDSTLFVKDGSYTTCDCPPDVTPSYSLRSSEMKLAEKWVYTGPIQLFLFNVPTPLWLPFGFLPNVQGRRSGPLAPEYGEDRRGFYLKNWGWYFALNSYTDLTLQASVWSRGSFEVRPRFRYRKRYRYNGDLRLTYRREQIGEEEDPNFQNRHRGELEWNHSQELSPTARFNGDVNLVTSGDFARRNSDSYDEAISQEISSSVNYSKNWPNGGRQLNVSGNQKQQLRSGEVRMTLPNLSFSQNSFKPFKRDQGVGEKRWYERLTTSYTLGISNTYNFRPRDLEQLRQRGDSTLADSVARADIDWYEALVDRDKYELATGDDKLYEAQATHDIPLNLNFRVDRYNLSLSPNAQYSSEWYINTVRQVAKRDSAGGVGNIVERTEPGFYAQREFSTSFSAGTELFGTFPVGVGSFQGLRHRLSPSLSANYKPNFNAPEWGRTRQIRFEDGTVVPPDSLNRPSRYEIVNGSSIRRSTEQWSLNFSLSNVFETKRVEVDSSGSRESQTVKLLNLDLSGLSYNFAADSFRVGRRIGINARTRIDPINVRMQSNFSPYALRPGPSSRNTEQRRLREVDRLMVTESPLTPARLTDFRLSLSADFSSENGGRRRSYSSNVGSGTRGMSSRLGGLSNTRQRQGQQPSRGQQQRTGGSSQSSSPSTLSDLSMPWSLSFDFNYSFSKPRKDIRNRKATLGVDFSLNVTPLWRVQGNTGYDFIDKKLSTTRIRISRNLGCWNMSFSWVPFGEFQQFGFNLQVSSGRLSQLLQLQIPNQGGEGRFGGFGQQLRNTAQGAAGMRGGGSNFGGRSGSGFGRPGSGGFP